LLIVSFNNFKAEIEKLHALYDLQKLQFYFYLQVDSFTLFMVTCVAIFAIIQASAAADSEEIQDQETDQEIQESRRSGRFLRWPLTLATSRLMQIKKRAGPPNSNFGAPPKKIHQRAPLKKREPIRLRLKPSSQLSQSFKNGRKQPFFTAGHAAAKKRLPTNNFILKKQLHPGQSSGQPTIDISNFFGQNTFNKSVPRHCLRRSRLNLAVQ
jgi:hypothetical protein